MAFDVTFNTRHAVTTREISCVYLLTVILGISIELLFGGARRLGGRLLQALIGLFQLDRRIRSIVSREVGIHV